MNSFLCGEFFLVVNFFLCSEFSALVNFFLFGELFVVVNFCLGLDLLDALDQLDERLSSPSHQSTST